MYILIKLWDGLEDLIEMRLFLLPGNELAAQTAGNTSQSILREYEDTRFVISNLAQTVSSYI